MFLIGFLTIVTPDINHIYIPFDVTSDPMAIFVRTYGGFFLAAGYLTIRFIYSSSKVQIGNILISIIGCMMVARVFSFIYEGFYQNSIYTFLVMLVLFSCLYYLQKKRRTEIY
jgi:CDP-diglyceride synthetase